MDARTRAKYEARARIIKALAHPTRLYIVDMLTQEEKCVCEITEKAGADISTVSKHLSILQQAGFLLSRKDKRWVYYSLAGRKASPAVQKALKWVSEALSGDKLVSSDASALKKIIGMEKEKLCRVQANR